MPLRYEIPNVGVYDFPDDMSEEDIYAEINDVIVPNADFDSPDPEQVRNAPHLFPDIDRGSFFGGLESGVERLGRTPEAAAAGIGRSQEELDALKAQMDEEEYRQRYRASLDDVTDQWGRGEYLGAAGTLFGDVLPQTLGESIPDMGIIGAGVWGGAWAGAKTGLALGAPIPVLGARPAGALLGAIVGGAVTGLPTFFGMNVERQIQERDITDPDEIESLKAAAVAALQGGLESLIWPVLGWIPGVKGLASPTIRELVAGGAKKLSLPQAGRIVAEHAAKGGATEAVTEVGQQMLERAQAGLDVTDPEALKEYIEAAILGGFLGIGFGGATGPYRAYKTHRQLQDIDTATQEVARLRREAVRQNMERENQTYTDPETGEKKPIITDPARLLPVYVERNKYAYDGPDPENNVADKVNATLAEHQKEEDWQRAKDLNELDRATDPHNRKLTKKQKETAHILDLARQTFKTEKFNVQELEETPNLAKAVEEYATDDANAEELADLEREGDYTAEQNTYSLTALERIGRNRGVDPSTLTRELLQLRSGRFPASRLISEKDIVEQAQAKNIKTGNKSFDAMVRRVTGAKSLKEASAFERILLADTLARLDTYNVPTDPTPVREENYTYNQFSKAEQMVLDTGLFNIKNVMDETGTDTQTATDMRDQMIRQGLVRKKRGKFRSTLWNYVEARTDKDGKKIAPKWVDEVAKDIKTDVPPPVEVEPPRGIEGAEVTRFEPRALPSGRHAVVMVGETRADPPGAPGTAVVENVGERVISVHDTEAEAQAIAERYGRSETAQTDLELRKQAFTPLEYQNFVRREAAKALRRGPARGRVLDALNAVNERRGLQAKGIPIELVDNVRDALNRAEAKKGVTEDIEGEVTEGAYLDGLIYLSMDAAINRVRFEETKRGEPLNEIEREELMIKYLSGVLSHEQIHALKAAGILKDTDFKLLARYATTHTRPEKFRMKGLGNAKWTYLDDVRAMQPNLSEAALEEEAVAEMFRDWAQDRSSVTGKPASLFRRIVKFISTLGGFFKEHGVRDVNEIFGEIETGTLGEGEATVDVGDGGRRLSVAPPIGTAGWDKWFGKSTVVNDNGDPLPMYRGMRKSPDPKDLRRAVSSHRANESYSSSPGIASIYATSRRGGELRQFQEAAVVRPAFLAIQNPLDLTPSPYDPDRNNPRTSFGALLDTLRVPLATKAGLDVAQAIIEELHMREQMGMTETNFDGVAGGTYIRSSDDAIQIFEDQQSLVQQAIFNKDPEGLNDARAEMEAVLDSMMVDAYALADLQLVTKVAEARGYDGIKHLDVVNSTVVEEAAPLLGKPVNKIEGLTPYEGHYVNVTWRPFTPAQAKSPFNEQFDESAKFSRAQALGQPAQMDFSDDKIQIAIDYFSKNPDTVEEARAHFARVNIDLFLDLTTPMSGGFSRMTIEADRFKTSNIEPYGDPTQAFDPAEVDRDITNAIPYLKIIDTGEVVSHEGRHRAASLKRGGATTIPIMMQYEAGAKNLIGEPGKPMPDSLIGQFNSDFIFPMIDSIPAFKGNLKAIKELVGLGTGETTFPTKDEQPIRKRFAVKVRRVGRPTIIRFFYAKDAIEAREMAARSPNIIRGGFEVGMPYLDDPTLEDDMQAPKLSIRRILRDLEAEEGRTALEIIPPSFKEKIKRGVMWVGKEPLPIVLFKGIQLPDGRGFGLERIRATAERFGGDSQMRFKLKAMLAQSYERHSPDHSVTQYRDPASPGALNNIDYRMHWTEPDTGDIYALGLERFKKGNIEYAAIVTFFPEMPAIEQAPAQGPRASQADMAAYMQEQRTIRERRQKFSVGLDRMFNPMTPVVRDMNLPAWKAGNEARGVDILAKIKASNFGPGTDKKDAIKWTGIEEFLTPDDTAKFSRDEVLEFIENNGPVVEETIAGEQFDDEETDTDETAFDWHEEVMDEDTPWGSDMVNSNIVAIHEGDYVDELLQELTDEYLDEHFDKVVAELGVRPTEENQTLDMFEEPNAALTRQQKDWDDKAATWLKEEYGDEIEEKLEDKIREQAILDYQDQPFYRYQDQSGTGYEIIGRDDIGYWLNGDRGDDIHYMEGVHSFNEAEVQAYDRARERGDLQGEDVSRDAEGQVRWRGFVTDGEHENYREMKIKLPEIEKDFYVKAHFPDRNIVTFLRLTDRIFPLGEITSPKVPADDEIAVFQHEQPPITFKALRATDLTEGTTLSNALLRYNERREREALLKTYAIDEFQSDWHQRGRKYGYATGQDVNDLFKQKEDLRKDVDMMRENMSPELLQFFGKLRHLIHHDYAVETFPRILGEVAGGERGAGLTKDVKPKTLFSELAKLRKQPRYLVIKDKVDAALARIEAYAAAIKAVAAEQQGAPAAPFSGDGWMALGLKRALIDAVEGGHEIFAWANSEVLVNRWSGRYRTMYETQYDKKMPSLVKKITGIEPKQMDLDGEALPREITWTIEPLRGFSGTTYAVMSPSEGAIGNYLTQERAQEEIDQNTKQIQGWHYIEITPELREQILAKGLPQFSQAPVHPHRPENGSYERFTEKDRTLWNAAKKWLKKELAPGGLLPVDAFDRKIERDSEFNAIELSTIDRVKWLNRAIRKATGKRWDQLTDAQRTSINETLAGREDQTLPPVIRQAIFKMRQHIDILSGDYVEILRREIDAYRAQGQDADAQAKANLLEVIAGNIGEYLHRSYRAFDDPNWVRNIPRDVYDIAYNYIMQQNGGNAEETYRLMETLTKIDTAYDGIEAFIKESTLGAKDVSILLKRKNIAPEIRALLGEHTDARLNYAKTTTKMGRLIFNQRFLDRVLEQGEGVFLFKKGTQPPGFTEEMAGIGSTILSPLNGMMTTPEIKQAFIDALNKPNQSNMMRQAVALNAMVKYGKTIISPTTQFRNLMSAYFFTVSNGHWDLSYMNQALKMMGAYIGNLEGGARDYHRELVRLGVLYNNPRAGALMDFLKESRENKALNKFLSGTGTVRENLRLLTEYAQKFYMAGDDLWKIIGYENELATFMDAKGMTREEAAPIVAQRIRDTYPTYSMVGAGMQKLRRFPLAGTFVSFPAEIIRTRWKMIEYIRKDLKDPDLKPNAYKRIAGLAITSAWTYAFAALTKSLVGLSDDEEEALRLMGSPWAENSQFWYWGRDEEGNIRMTDLSFMDAYNILARPITSLLRDQPPEDAFFGAIRDVLSPFIGIDIATGALYEIARNQKLEGGRVYNPDEGGLEQSVSIAGHLGDAVQPGIMSWGFRMGKALAGQRSPSGRVYDVKDEMAAFVGFRTSTFDPKLSLYYRTFEFSDRISNARSILSKAASDPNTVSEADLIGAFERANEARLDAYRDMQRFVTGAKSAGLTDQNVRQILKASGVSKQYLNNLVRGKPAPRWKIGTTFLKGATKRAKLLIDRETAQELRRRRRFVRGMARELQASP